MTLVTNREGWVVLLLALTAVFLSLASPAALAVLNLLSLCCGVLLGMVIERSRGR